MARGYNVVLGHAHSRADEAYALTAVLETRHCDAIVILGDMQGQPQLLADLRDSIIPVVALWQGSSPLEVPTVDVDNEAGVVAGVDHLIGLGPPPDRVRQRAAVRRHPRARGSVHGADRRSASAACPTTTSCRCPTRPPAAIVPCGR